MILRCGRLDDHDQPDGHDWTPPREPFQPARTYHCNGHIVTTLAEREYADRADIDDKADDDLREWVRAGWAS